MVSVVLILMRLWQLLTWLWVLHEPLGQNKTSITIYCLDSNGIQLVIIWISSVWYIINEYRSVITVQPVQAVIHHIEQEITSVCRYGLTRSSYFGLGSQLLTNYLTEAIKNASIWHRNHDFVIFLCLTTEPSVHWWSFYLEWHTNLFNWLFWTEIKCRNTLVTPSEQNYSHFCSQWVLCITDRLILYWTVNIHCMSLLY